MRLDLQDTGAGPSEALPTSGGPAAGRRRRRLWLVLAGVLIAGALVVVVSRRPDGPVPFEETVVDSDAPFDPWMKGVGDLDGDGQIDLVVCARNGPLVWYRYPGWHRYDIAETIGTPGTTTGIDVVDADLDGDPDVALANGRWFENPRPNAEPTSRLWAEHLIDDTRAHDIFLVDLDGDSDLDAVKRDQMERGDTIRLLRRDGPNEWSSTTLSAPAGEGLATADIDNDGRLDVVISGRWYRNPGVVLGAEWIQHVYATTYDEPDVVVATGLVNDDDRLDIVLSPAESAGETSGLVWFEGPDDPTTAFAEHAIRVPVEAVLHSLQLADFDLDGALDVATAEMHQGEDPDEVTVYFNRDHGGRWVPQVLSTEGSHSLRAADIDRDGDVDLFGANWNTGEATDEAVVKLWRNRLDPLDLSNIGWTRHLIDAARPARAVFVTSGDIDGDGLADVATGACWYHNPGDSAGQWERREFGGALHNLAALADFDGDGDLDALGTAGVGSEPSASFSFALNDGSGDFAVIEGAVSAEGDFLQGVAVGRFGHGPLQVALSWHEPGHGVQLLTIPRPPVGSPWDWERISEASQDEQLSAGDIDRDGRVDLLLGTRWLRNAPDGWDEHVLFETDDLPDRSRLADIDADGRLDAVVGYEAISTEGLVAWYEQPLTATDHWTEHVIGEVIGPMSLDVGDLDFDCDLDVVVGEHNLDDPKSASLYIFENPALDPDGEHDAWARYLVYEGDEHHDGAQLVDIDSDGDLDIVSIGWGHDDVVLYENGMLRVPTEARRCH